MDCYAVGPTLGAGVAAILRNDTIFYPWCYEKAEVLDNGPLRFTARLDFAPVRIAGDTAVVEHRLISLDAGSYLNNTEVWYDGLSGNADVVVGFPLRDDSPSFISEGIIAYSDPTQDLTTDAHNSASSSTMISPQNPTRIATCSA